MKQLLLLFFAFLFIGAANAQIDNPVKWNYSAKKIADKTYEIHMTAALDEGWHLYAQESGEGPIPTSFSYINNPLLAVQGKPKEDGKLVKEYDKNFGSVLKFYSSKVDFVQVVKLRTNAKTIFKGTVNYMVCNDHKCLPPKDVAFSLKLGS